MAPTVRVVDAPGLPAVVWRWEPETDILAGALRPAPGGPAGCLELSGFDGSVAVVDLADGRLAGLDVVVWPEVVTVPGLVPPAAGRTGSVQFADSRGARPPAATTEQEVAMAVRANPGEDIIHLRVGAPRPALAVQVADHLLVEVDDAGGLAGFWLSAVPPLTAGDA